MTPREQLEHVYVSAKSIFAQEPQLKDGIEKMKRELGGETAKDREFRIWEEERMERLMNGNEAIFEEREMYGESSQGRWWEKG